jgi:hypothetical protein
MVPLSFEAGNEAAVPMSAAVTKVFLTAGS